MLDSLPPKSCLGPITIPLKLIKKKECLFSLNKNSLPVPLEPRF